MTFNKSFLVVGGDSLIGTALIKSLEERSHVVFSTTRRQKTLGANRVFLDFESNVPFYPPKTVDYAFIVAAATNCYQCETDSLAQRINEELIPRFIISLLEQGIFVTFISTNAVFDGKHPWPQEDDPHGPNMAYAKQKSDAETTISLAATQLGSEDRLGIVRITKTFGKNTPPLPDWVLAWNQREIVHPFSDLIIAPISVSFVGNSLARIAEKRISGNFHLSGAENINYADLAFSLAEKLGTSKDLIMSTTAKEKNVQPVFKVQYSGLGMNRTSSLTGIMPQTLGEVTSDLFNYRS
jgi:dTDP-4-dehydrorhamnose reductase